MKRWEYKVVFWDTSILTSRGSFDLEITLNEHGINGWEVVSMTNPIDRSENTDEGIDSSVETTSFLIVMKRETTE